MYVQYIHTYTHTSIHKPARESRESREGREGKGREGKGREGN